MKLLLITPPMTQVNTPYPATAYLTGYLRSKNFQVFQQDLGLDLFHKIFSKTGLERISKEISKKKKKTEFEIFFLENLDDYLECIGPVIAFLQGKDPSLAIRISKRKLFPEGPRFLPLEEHPQLLIPFGDMGTHDQAKYLASLFLDDLADLIKNSIDERFEFSRYAEQLASSNPSFNPLLKAISNKTIIDEWIEEITSFYVKKYQPDLVAFTLPFPGNVLGAMRSANFIKTHFPQIKTAAGGGFVNTELRTLEDTRVFDFFDFLSFDDGEAPLERILNFISGNCPSSELVRTWYRQDHKIIKCNALYSIPFKDLPGPTYDGLDIDRYVSMLEIPNPMHRMWSDFKWNKLMMAHGCYWKKCTFCDVNLDYIDRFEPSKVQDLINSIVKIKNETGQSGFHFVDEAAPPALIKQFSNELIQRHLKITWWGNLRFDKQFANIAELMADSGCVAVTGGIEVASPRLLNLINKGVSIEQVAQVTKAFSEQQIFVHAYLMYGYPSQTVQETIDSLEIVRQLFAENCLQSAYWHKFAATIHSPVGKNPDQYGIKLLLPKTPKEGLFAINGVDFIDSVEVNHDLLGIGLKKALYNYIHQVGIEEDVRNWFDFKVPKALVPKDFIKKAIRSKK